MGVEVVTTPFRGSSLPSAGLRSLLGQRAMREVDVVHCNLVGPTTMAVTTWAKQNDVPVVLHAHVTREDFAGSFRGSTAVGPALERYLRWAYARGDLLLCPSEYTKDVLESYPVETPIRSVTNGVDRRRLAGFESLRTTYRDRFDLEGPVVFAVGNVFERKGVSTFCRLAEDIDAEFVWFGPYDTGPHASRTVRRWVKNPPENVTFTGWIDDIRGAYAAGDIYLLPTTTENQGISVLEAMACGKPVVLGDIPPFREYYRDGADCLLCSNHEEFRDAISRLIADGECRADLGRNARETAKSHGLDRVGEELLDAYETVMADGPTTD